MKPKIIIAFVLLLIIVFISVIPRKKYEFFESLNPISAMEGDSTQSLYYKARSLTDFDNTVSQNFNGLIDYTSSMLLMKRCYNFPIYLLEDNESLFEGFPIYTKGIGIYTNDFKEVQRKILDNLIEFADRQPTGLIKGDVYILLTQQPYYRNVDGTEISLDSTTINERHNYYNPKYTGKPVIDQHPIYYSFVMIFSAYNSDGSYAGCTDKFYSIMNYWNNFSSNENQCFIRCVNDDTKFCGCATGTEPGATQRNKDAAASIGTTPYDSMCLGPSLSSDDKRKITPSNYYILYLINQNYNIDYPMSRIFDTTDTCKLVNNSLPTDPVVRSKLKI